MDTGLIASGTAIWAGVSALLLGLIIGAGFGIRYQKRKLVGSDPELGSKLAGLEATEKELPRSASKGRSGLCNSG